MTVIEHRRRWSQAGCAAVISAVLLAGCGQDPESAQTTTSTPPPGAATTSANSTVQAGPQNSFDPCTTLTPPFLTEHQWDALPPAAKQNSTGGISWKGCRYVARAGYGLTIQSTNGTLDQVREKFPSAVDISVGSRKALRYEARPDVPGGCTVNVEMQGGSLYILVDDPSGKHPRKLSPCDNATDIAQTVAPLLPSGS
ncbi:DUF3558 domain-containing protein [Nocardia amamiensis]|uniref:DUF3558 domain-containing protein n=1 Tax=Nocardia amamiensis TaxID=404578 RepID=UPI0009FECCF7|nr:DUF3558 domain-containing protein [Nocardia amamiensis]